MGESKGDPSVWLLTRGAPIEEAPVERFTSLYLPRALHGTAESSVSRAKMRPTSPYSRASSALIQWFRSVSRCTFSNGWPVAWAKDSAQALAHACDLTGFNLYVGRRPPYPTERLMQEEPSVGERLAVLSARGGINQCSGARAPSGRQDANL